MDNDSDGNEPVDSCDETDLAEHESRLYSLIHHSADNFNHGPSISSEKPSPDLRINPYVALSTTHTGNNRRQINSSQNVPLISVTPPHFHQSAWNKASRLNDVHQIINSADKSKERSDNLFGQYLKELNDAREKFRNKMNTSSNDSCINPIYPISATNQQPTVVPPRNNPERVMVLNPKSSHFSANISPCTSIEKSSLLNSFSFDLSTHVSSTIRTGNLFDIQSEQPTKQVFRLDNRLFLNAPFNLDSKIQESHNLLFSGKPKTHNIEAQGSKKHQASRSKPATVIKEITVIDIEEVPKEDDKLQPCTDDVIIIDDNDDLPVVIAVNPKKENISLTKPVDSINNKPIVPEDLIVLCSDKEVESDSDESVCVLPPPPKLSPPVVFSVEESSDDDVTPMGPPLKRPVTDVELEQQDNSFDFLDSTYDVDALAKSQARILCNLIGSKESLIDERLFQTETSPNKKQSPTKRGNINQSQTKQTSSETPVKPSSKKSEPKVSESPVSKTGDKTSLRNSPDVTIIASLKTPQPLMQITFTNIPNTASNRTAVASPLEGHAQGSSVRKRYQQVSDVSSSTNVSPTLDIAPDMRDAILKYIDARTNGITHVKTDDIHGAGQSANSQNPPAMNEDIMAVHSGTMTDSTVIDEILRDSANKLVNAVQQEEPRKLDKKAKRKLKREKKLKKRMKQTESPHQRSMSTIVYTKHHGEEYVDKAHKGKRKPTSWNAHMKQFYTDSWGGELFDVELVKRSMSNDPGLWKVSNEDRFCNYANRRSGNLCTQCQGRHHSLLCTLRTPICIMCGVQGHRQDACPNSICLECGHSSPKYVDSCRWCESSHHGNCTKCVWRHDPSELCRTASEDYQQPSRQEYQPSPPKVPRFTPVKERTFDRRRRMPSSRPPFRPYWKNQFNRGGARWSKFDQKPHP